MASFPTTYAAYRMMNAYLGSADVRLRYVMSSTTCDTERNAEHFEDYTTIDVFDGAGYADVQLTGEAVAVDTVNFRAEFDAANSTASSFPNGTRPIVGAVPYVFVDGTDANDEPLGFIPLTSFNPGGVDFTLQWDAEGIFHLVCVSA